MNIISHHNSNSRLKLSIFDLVLNGKANSRKDIISALAIRPNTVSEMVAELVDMELIWEQKAKASGRGRPTVSLVANSSRFVCILFQVVGQSIVASLRNLNNQELWSETHKLCESADNHQVLKIFTDLYEGARSAVPKASDCASVIFSMPGILDPEKCIWKFVSRWPNMRDLDLKRVINCGHERLYLFRNLDLELSALTVKEDGGHEAALIVHWGQGIGCSFSLPSNNGLSRPGQFGEIGHWVMARAGGDLCRCGGKGCLETVASLWALKPLLKTHWPEVEGDEQEIANQLHLLDLLSVPEFRDAVTAISNTLTNLSRTFFPSKILMTGPFVNNPYVWAELNKQYSAAGALSSLEVPPLINVSRSLDLERQGALNAVLPKYLLTYIEKNSQDGSKHVD
ncbi:ROK family transcriptional regulator [Pseudovibrio exalbescens]|uniref:ROK family transcriptional regulator n=1 Tax=Pseudovibrio exalbescens TaxID=197461 RepID=UPI000C9B6510|nr:ROK family transcriptional regulator [Pseudovibrio exalbescens]